MAYMLKAVEDFKNVHFSCVRIECQVGDPDMDDFLGLSGNLFLVFIYYFQVGDVGTGWLSRSLWCILHWLYGYVLSCYVLDICWTHQCKTDCNFVQDRSICRLYSVSDIEVFSVGCASLDFVVLVHEKITCTLVQWKILLNSSLRQGT